MNKIYILRIASLVSCLLLAGFLIYAWSNINAQKTSSVNDPKRLYPVTQDVFGVPYSLKNHLGETVTDKTYAGQFQLLYFGFTYCPAICPTGLQTISRAITGLGELDDTVQPIFITVDPERDTAEALNSYVTMFHPRLVGFTGQPEDIAKVLRGYKIYAAKVDDPQMSEYTMDHSAFTYLIGPEGNLLHIFKHEDTSEIITDVMRQWIMTTEQ
jgi:protein SCO1/2